MFEADNTVELLRAVVDAHGHADAYVEADGTRLTYGQWQRAADGVAAGLAELGVGSGDVVCLMLPSSIDYIVCYQAAMRLGAITTGINLRLGPTEVRHILERTEPALVVVDDIEPPIECTQLQRSDLSELARLDPVRLPRLRTDQPVAIVWTSGTTGKPKGAVFDHNNLRAVTPTVGPLSAPFDRRLSPLPFPHVGTMTRQWDEILNVMAIVITPTPWRAGDTLRLMERERVTVGQGVPTQWELILRHPDLRTTDLSSLRLVASGGSRVPTDLVVRLREELGVPVLNRYASTEAVVVSGTRPDDPDEVIVDTVGRPGNGVELRVVGDDGSALPVGRAGRVQVRSAAVMRGYWRDRELTSTVLDADGWLDLGDVGALGADGNLRFHARKSEMYVRGGYNVYPGEVEQVLREHPLVKEVAMVGVPDPVLGEIGHAFVVATGEPDLDELRCCVKGQLADYKAPDRLTLLDELPLTSMNKVDRRELRQLADRGGS